MSEAVLHWSLGSENQCGFDVGVLQVLLHTLVVYSDKRPSFAWMKSKIERLMRKCSSGMLRRKAKKGGTIKKLKTKIRNKAEEEAWILSGAKTASLNMVTIDPREEAEQCRRSHME